MSSIRDEETFRNLEETRKLWKNFLERLEKIRKRAKSFDRKSLENIFLKAMRVAKKINHRRLFVISGDNYKEAIEILITLVKAFANKIADNQISVFFACHNKDVFPESEHLEILESGLRDEKIKLEVIEYKYSQFAMGRTFDLGILDFYVDLHPNDIGRFIETVKGGGAIFILTQKLEKFAELKTKFHEYITTIPWRLEDVPGRLIKFFIKKMFKNPAVYIIDADEHKILKEGVEPKKYKVFKRKELVLPEKTIIPREIYEIAITQDQVNVLKALETILKNRDRKETVIVTADRGRGKSAAVGLFAGAMAKLNAGRGPLGRYLILVTAPQEYNVYTFFEFAERALKALGEKVKIYRNPPEIRGQGFVIAYYPAFEAVKLLKRERVELTIVDEAAGIPVPILWEILERSKKTVYSSTIHGYEGAGRGFSIRFINVVKKRRDIGFKHVTMSEPIRYNFGDPIEALLFDFLLLKATPPKLTEEDMRDIENLNVYLEKVDLSKWFLDERDDLKDFIGIYVFAHYRNEPKDLGILADAPHYEAYALRTSTGKIVTAILVAKEGDLPMEIIREVYRNKEAEPSGHLIPMVVENHYRSVTFPQLKGFRIVRIATHPQVMRKGLGSKALEYLEKIAKERGFDWIGSGFGANFELIRFWLKNRYVPIHISPKRNKVSGEYTVVVVKPLNPELEETIRLYYREFRIKFVEWLRYVHYDIEPELARELLLGGFIWRQKVSEFKYDLKLTEIQKKRLLAYIHGVLSYELACDAIHELVKAYFIDESPEKPRLPREAELLLITRTLQARTLGQALDLLDFERDKAKVLFGKSIRKLYNYFIKQRGSGEEF